MYLTSLSEARTNGGIKSGLSGGITNAIIWSHSLGIIVAISALTTSSNGFAGLSTTKGNLFSPLLSKVDKKQ